MYRLPLLALVAGSVACASAPKECPDGYRMNLEGLCVSEEPGAAVPDATDDPRGGGGTDSGSPDGSGTAGEKPTPPTFDTRTVEFTVFSDALDAVSASTGRKNIGDVGWYKLGFGTVGETVATLRAMSTLERDRLGNWTQKMIGAPKGGKIESVLAFEFIAELGFEIGGVEIEIPFTNVLPGGSLKIEIPVDEQVFQPLLMRGSNPSTVKLEGGIVDEKFGPFNFDNRGSSFALDLGINMTTTFVGSDLQIDGSNMSEVATVVREGETVDLDFTDDDAPRFVEFDAKYTGEMAHTLNVEITPTIDIPPLNATFRLGPILIPVLDGGIDRDIVESDWETFKHVRTSSGTR